MSKKVLCMNCMYCVGFSCTKRDDVSPPQYECDEYRKKEIIRSGTIKEDKPPKPDNKQENDQVFTNADFGGALNIVYEPDDEG